MVADWDSGEPKTMESEKAEEWVWYDLDKVPEPMFEFSKLALDSLKTGRSYY